MKVQKYGMILESRREEDIKDDTTVEGDNSEGESVTVCLLK